MGNTGLAGNRVAPPWKPSGQILSAGLVERSCAHRRSLRALRGTDRHPEGPLPPHPLPTFKGDQFLFKVLKMFRL